MPWRIWTPPRPGQPGSCEGSGNGCLSHIKGKESFFFIHPNLKPEFKDIHDEALYQLTEGLNNLIRKTSENNRNNERCLTLVKTSMGCILCWSACGEKSDVTNKQVVSEDEILNFFGIDTQDAPSALFKLSRHGSHVHCIDPGRGCIAPTKTKFLFIDPNLKPEFKDIHDEALYQLTEGLNNLIRKTSENTRNNDIELRFVICSEGLIPIWSHIKEDPDNIEKIELDEKDIDQMFGIQ